MKKYLSKETLLVLSLLCTGPTLAELSVNAKNWPKQLPGSEYNDENYYSNGQTDNFHNAINSSNVAITTAEQKTLEAMVPESEHNRWYFKAGLHKSTARISGVKNSSSNAGIATYTLTTPAAAATSATGGALGVGYVFDAMRFDGEYIFIKNSSYNPAPLYTGRPTTLTSTISGQHLIANAYYDFNNVPLVQPFVGLSLGAGMNKTAATFAQTNGVGTDGAKTKSAIGLDYGVQAGATTRIMGSRFYADVSYRYLKLGSVKWSDSSGTLLLKGKRTLSGVALGLRFLL